MPVSVACAWKHTLAAVRASRAGLHLRDASMVELLSTILALAAGADVGLPAYKTVLHGKNATIWGKKMQCRRAHCRIA